METFLGDVRQLDATDLVCHAIPTRSGSRAYRAREPLYTPREIEWQQVNIPKMLEAGIITYTSSPWSAKSRFVIKKSGDLRPVHQFCALNDATIKSNYSMSRVEPILNNLMQPRFKLYWWADASNGFFAVPMFPPHAYKTGFSCFLGQFCYLRMAQGLCGAPHTFAQLKDYVGGPIPSPNAEPAIFGITESDAGASAYESFFDDDSGSDESLEAQIQFLHNHYFPRIKWARLSLSPKKSAFAMDEVECLGFSGSPTGLRPDETKLKAIRDYPTPESAEEIDNFLFMTTYLRKLISGRAEHACRMKDGIQTTPEWRIKAGTNKDGTPKRTMTKMVTRFVWGPVQEEALSSIKRAIIHNACWGGDPRFQFHLATDASKLAYGGVLFQIPTQPVGTRIVTS